MDFSFTPEQEELRKEVRDFLEEEIKIGSFIPTIDSWEVWSPPFSKKIAAKGWIGYTWPKEYGGQGRSYLDRLIIIEELLRYGSPCGYHWFGDRQVGPTLLAFGTEEQKREFLPRIVKAEISFCLGMSEPGAGSDLASVQLRAVETEDGFILNGQKIWTSGAHLADYCYVVARTDPTAPKHRGISELIVDMKTPGITIRPIVDLSGRHLFNEVFFDNVVVPKSALIGQKNRGWYQIVQQLDYERSGLERIMSYYPLFDALKKFVAQNPRLKNNPLLRHKIGELEIEFEVGRWLIYRVAWLLSSGKVPNYEAAQAKIFGTAFEQKLSHTVFQIFGLHSQIIEGKEPLNGWVSLSSLTCLGKTIQAGTSEILKNIVAIRGLNLPSG